MHMRHKSLVGLIIVVVAVLACTCIGAVYIVDKSNDPLIEQDGGTYSETVSLGNMAPGEEYAVHYTADGGVGSAFNVRVSGGEAGSLSDYVTIAVNVNGENVYTGTYADCAETGVSCSVSGKFDFDVIFMLDASVGNEAQGLACEIITEYSLEGD